MSGSLTDKLRKASGSTRPVVTTLALPKANGATSAELTSGSGWNTTTGVDVVIYRRQLNTTTGLYEKINGTQTEWVGILVGTTLTLPALPNAGTEPASGYAADGNTVVFCGPTAQWSDDLIETLLLILNQDGTLKNNAITSAAQITDGIIGDAEMATAVKPVTLFNENTFDHIVSGCVWTADAAGSTRNASCASGVVMIAGKRLTVAAVTARSFTASKDVYCDLKDNGDGTAIWVYYDNTLNAASPTFVTTTGTVRGAIVVVGASNIATAASINQGQEDRVLPIASSIPYAVTDSLGNLICPRDPNRKTLGYRQITSIATSGISASAQAVGGLSVPVIVPTGRKIKISMSAGLSVTSSGSAGTGTAISICDGSAADANRISQINGNTQGASGTGSGINYTDVELTPSTSSKTYLGCYAGSGAASTTVNANAIAPAYIKVELA